MLLTVLPEIMISAGKDYRTATGQKAHVIGKCTRRLQQYMNEIHLPTYIVLAHFS